jgi:hypothetical protein
VAALLVVGCGTRAHNEAVARAEAWSVSHHDPGRVTCSSGIGGFRPQTRSPDFLCLIRHSVADCDELRVRRAHGVWNVSLRRRGVDCVLAG